MILSICEFLLAIHWFNIGIYNIAYEEPILSESTYCITNAFISTMAGFGEFVINILICIYLSQSLHFI